MSKTLKFKIPGFSTEEFVSSMIGPDWHDVSTGKISLDGAGEDISEGDI